MKCSTGKSADAQHSFPLLYPVGHFLYITSVLSQPTTTSPCPGKINYFPFYICVSSTYYIITSTVLQPKSCDASACLWETASSRERTFHPTDRALLPALPLFFSYPVTLFLMPARVTSLVLFLAKTLVIFLPGSGYCLRVCLTKSSTLAFWYSASLFKDYIEGSILS